jgi:hypothetical protein
MYFVLHFDVGTVHDMYLVLYAFTSTTNSLLAGNVVSLFFSILCTLSPIIIIIIIMIIIIIISSI